MFSRRNFLRGLAVAPLWIQCLNSRAAAAAAPNTIVVTINLAGGNDGLNTVVPLTQYGTYHALRTPEDPPDGLALDPGLAAFAATAFDSNPATPAGSASHYAFNPAMTAMRSLYATGKLAVVAGVGLPLAETGSLNHDTASMDWQIGRINNFGQPVNGWLGQSLDATKAGSLGLAASLNGDTPMLLTGKVVSPLALGTPLENFNLDIAWGTNSDQTYAALKSLALLPTTNKIALADQKIAETVPAQIASVQRIATAVPASDYPPAAANSYLGAQLQQIARLIIGKSGLRAYYAVQGGYDTHSSQAPSQNALLADLSTSISDFYNYLKLKNASKNVVLMTISDFGRRPQANENFGTDHGGATVSFVLGDSVVGGVYGTYPSLSSLDVNGNLKVTADFRSLITDMIGFMGGDAQTVLGSSFAGLGLFG